MRAGRLGAVIAVAGLVGCFEIRPLDRVFDGGPAEGDAAPDSAPIDPDCVPQGRRDRTCDGIDDDCDGLADEDVPTETCGVGLCGETAAGGRCVSGVYLDCTPGAPQDEACNAVDDDCDGDVDEALERPCEGDCGGGVETCRDGRWSACAIADVDEVCDDVDNDCDGATDEDLTRPCDTPCGPGIETCTRGRWRNCQGPEPQPEECNGLDDDCDGIPDELEPRACEPPLGQCGPATEACADGTWGECLGAPAAAEACNGLDDDCDGVTDELEPRACEPPPGQCAPATQACEGGVWGACQGRAGGGREACNGEDDDCDGVVDELVCNDCELEVRWTCYEFVGPCPPGPPERQTRCVQLVGGAEGEPGDGMGRRIVRGGDLDGDGVDDFVAVGDIGVMAVSGATGDRIWYEGEGRASGGDVVVLRADADPLVVVGDLADELRGELNLLDGGSGDRVRRVDADVDMVFGLHLAAVDGDRFFAIGDPAARDGQGRIRFMTVGRLNVDPAPIGVDLMIGPGLGGVMALGRDEDGVAVMAVTVGPPGEPRVQLFTDPAAGAAAEPDDLIGPGPGVGARLAMESVRTGQPIEVLSLTDGDPRLTMASLDQQIVRMPLAAPGLDVSSVPAGDDQPPIVLVGSHGLVQMLTFGDNEQVAVVDVPGPVDARWGAAVSGAARGPDGARVMAVGAPDAADGAGRVEVYRVD